MARHPRQSAEWTTLGIAAMTSAVAVTRGNKSQYGGVTTVMTVFIGILIAIPSRLIVQTLGGAGTPAEIVGLMLGAWWVIATIVWPRADSGRQPVRLAALVFVAAVLASYIAAATRPIDAAGLRAADLGVVSVASWLGILLIMSDGPVTLVELHILLRRLTMAGGALATLGILQFITGMPFTNYLQVPGLSANNELTSVLDRGGLVRPAGTALHPIEFGAVLTTILPIALHYALSDVHRSRLARWFPVIAIAIAVPISISRSAIVSAVVVLCFLLPTWTRAARRNAYGGILVLFAGLYLVVPGLLGTITGLFTNISNDSSAASRTGSYSLAAQFIDRAPVFGGGFRTFRPSYRILDNQYLGTLIDMGVVGLLALLGLFLTGMITALQLRKAVADPAIRGLAQAMAASVAAAGCSFALFDAFYFPMAATLIFLVLGSIGALRRLATSDQLAAPKPLSRPTAKIRTRLRAHRVLP